MENFNNSIVLPENLPVVEKKAFTRLEKKYLQVMELFDEFIIVDFFRGLMRRVSKHRSAIIIFKAILKPATACIADFRWAWVMKMAIRTLHRRSPYGLFDYKERKRGKAMQNLNPG